MLISQASRNATEVYFELYWDFPTSKKKKKKVVTMSFWILGRRAISLHAVCQCTVICP